MKPSEVESGSAMSTLSRQKAVQSNLQRRARIIEAVRAFFMQHDYLDVETPCRIPAPAPETHIDAQASGSWYLQTSPELCMKRLLAAGYERIFQICRCFRKHERGNRHLPEITLLEWYTAGVDYTHMMVQCEQLVAHVLQQLDMDPILRYQEDIIDLRPPWPRLTVRDAFERFTDSSMDEALSTDRFDELMGLQIEPQLGRLRPVILMDYPRRHGALARTKPGHTELVERFEVYIGGLELCNAFSELTDPVEQRHRFTLESEQRRRAGKKETPLPEPFLSALARMPDAAGNALGLDRLTMLLCNAKTIDDVVAFVPEEL
jgi:lysyl-tRNA synthetase class 2